MTNGAFEGDKCHKAGEVYRHVTGRSGEIRGHFVGADVRKVLRVPYGFIIFGC